MRSWMKRALEPRFGMPSQPSVQESLGVMAEASPVERTPTRRPKKPFKQVVLDIGGLAPIFPPDLSTEPTRHDN